jgi:hypothetical protein
MKRDKAGRFVPNWNQEAKQPVNLSLTQTAWQLLEQQAQQQGISRSELVERFARSSSLLSTETAIGNETGSNSGAQADRLQSELPDHAVADLLREQEFLQVLLDNVQAGIVACDARGELKLFNQEARLFHGLPERPLPPEQWADYYDLYLPDGKTRMSKEDIPLFRALQGESVRHVEMMIIPKGGTARTLLANGQAIVTQDGKKLGAVVVMHDITEQKQIETMLRDREAQLQGIFQTIPDGIVTVDRSGQIISANPAAEVILKLTRSDITGRAYNDLAWSISTVEGDPFPEAELPFVRVMRSRQPVHGIEHAITHADGTRTILSINASPLFDAEGQIANVVTAISDITERKQAEAALRESEERYRSVIETAAEGIIFQYANGEIFTCNASAEAILGLTAEQLMGRTSLDPRWRSIYEDGSPFPGELHPSMVTLQTGEPQSNVAMGIHKPDGTLTWISVNTRPLFQPGAAAPFAVVASFFDITDRKSAEEERSKLIQEQAARLVAETAQQRSDFLAEVSAVLSSSLEYEHTLQSVADLAVPRFADWCSVDLVNDDGEISRVAVAHTNPEKVRLAWELAERFPRSLHNGYGIAEVIRSGKSEIVPTITSEQLAAVIQDEAHLQILQSLGLKSCIIAPLEARGRVLGSISLIDSESNRHYQQADLMLTEDLARRAAIAIDNARLFRQAQQARSEAEAVNRIKDEFLAVLSHELRSPLNPILGWSRLLQTKKLEDAKVTEALKTIERNARLQSELIEDLLDVSRILRGELSLNRAVVDLVPIIEAAIETVQLSAEAKLIQIETQFVAGLGRVLGDASRLQQIVWNLLSNAIKFTPWGGRVSVGLSFVTGRSSSGEEQITQEQITQEQMTNDQRQTTNYAQIIVSDTGQGISAEFLPHVFEYFRQADSTTTRRFGGLGLGLAIVRHLVELHGGTIEAESPGEGQGATFIVRLPLASGASPLSQAAPQPESLPRLDNVRVLVVDDEADARDFVAFLLEQQGATAMTVASASEALTAIAQFRPDLLLSDIGMPDVNGFMLIQEVRRLPSEQGGQVAAIALTAYVGEIDQQQALEAGFQRHLAKPVEANQLIKAIVSLLKPSAQRGI